MRQADRLIINVLSNYGLTLIGGIASLVLVPTVIADLGTAGFGLAAMLLATFTVTDTLAAAINRAMQRHVPQDLASGDPERVSATFNSALICYAVLGAIAALVIWFIRPIYLADEAITAELRQDGTIAFALVCVCLALGAPLFAYRAALEAIQRFDLVVIHVSAATVLRTLLVIGIFKAGWGSVLVYAVSQVAAVLGSCLLCRRALKRALPQLRESFRWVRKPAVKALALFAAAGLLITGGNVMGLEGFRIVVGVGMGMEDAGGLSAIWAFRSMVFMLIRSMTNVLTPTVSALDAQGASENVAKLLLASTKYAGVAAASICIVPLTVADSFLRLWLGEKFLDLSGLMYAVLLAQVPVAMSTSSQQVLVGLGRVNSAGPLVFVRGAGSLLASAIYVWLSPAPTLVGAAVVLYIVQVSMSLVLFMVGATAAKVGRTRAVVHGMFLPIALALVGTLSTWLVAGRIGCARWWNLMTCIAVGEAVFIALILVVGLGREERRRLMSFGGRVRAKLAPARTANQGPENP